jgi:hypothetical protein
LPDTGLAVLVRGAASAETAPWSPTLPEIVERMILTARASSTRMPPRPWKIEFRPFALTVESRTSTSPAWELKSGLADVLR